MHGPKRAQSTKQPLKWVISEATGSTMNLIYSPSSAQTETPALYAIPPAVAVAAIHGILTHRGINDKLHDKILSFPSPQIFKALPVVSMRQTDFDALTAVEITKKS